MIVCSCTMITSKDIAEAVTSLRTKDPFVVLTPGLAVSAVSLFTGAAALHAGGVMAAAVVIAAWCDATSAPWMLTVLACAMAVSAFALAWIPVARRAKQGSTAAIAAASRRPWRSSASTARMLSPSRSATVEKSQFNDMSRRAVYARRRKGTEPPTSPTGRRPARRPRHWLPGLRGRTAGRAAARRTP